MEAIAFIKPLHVALALTSGVGLLIRGVVHIRSGRPAAGRIARIAPHVVDTALLATGITMATMLGITPAEPWLGAKLVAVVMYVVAGTFAVKRARTTAGRSLALALALVLFGYIVSVALHHNPLPWTS